MFGKIYAVVLDCPDPQALAEFYQAILGGTIQRDPDGDWIDLVAEPGAAMLSFQQVAEHLAPVWPGEHGEQQFHLDIAVEDFARAEELLLELGARFVEAHEGFRVYLDPAGHPFCTVR